MKNFVFLILITASHFSKIIATLLVVKMIAIYSGAEGMARYGNYMSVISIAMTLSGGGIISGIAKYISQYKTEENRREKFIGSALLYSSIFSFVIIILGAFYSELLNEIIFEDKSFVTYIYIFLAAQAFCAATNFFSGVFNGFEDSFSYAISSIIGNIISIVGAFLIFQFDQNDAIGYALVLPLIVQFFPSAIVFVKKNIKIKFSKKTIAEDFPLLANYSTMLIVSSICFPIVEIAIRNKMLDHINITDVGIWQSMLKITSGYLSFFSILIGFYVVPKIAAAKNKVEIKSVVIKGILACSFLFFLIAIAVALCGEDIIRLLLSNSFVTMLKTLYLQMIGDYLRILGWVFGFVIVAKSATAIYIIGELIQGMGLIILTFLFVDKNPSISSISIAYAMNNAIYLFIISLGFFLYFKNNVKF